MSRIIAGAAGSIRLKAGAVVTRPTSDRVKESLFAQLDSLSAVDGLQVLDMFAGTGALGLEALSRGAKSAIFVERDRRAAEVIRANISLVLPAIQSTRPEVTAQIKLLDADRFLNNSSGGFDLVLIDPPYDFASVKLQELVEKLHPLINHEALIVIERSSRSEIIETPKWAVSLSNKSYGDTRICIFRKI